MATINFSGLGSGIDFSKLVDAAVAQRTVPVTQLQVRSSALNQRNGDLKQLNAKLIILTQAAKALDSQELGTTRLTTTSDDRLISAASTTEAVPGTLRFNISRLATSLTQTSRVYSSATDAVLTDGAATATFELRKGGAATGTAITITATNNTLEGLRDAINEAGAGVTATIVDIDGTGTQNKLVLSADETGAAGRVELVETTATGSAADIGLTSLGISSFADLDAQFTLNGLTLTRSSNNISDVVSGVSFALKQTGAVNVTVSSSSLDITQKLQNFVAAYNDVQSFIAGQYQADSSGRPVGKLAGDPTLRVVQEQLREAVGADSTSNGGVLKNLSELGIGRNTDGTLTLDETVLSGKLASAFSDVKSLLAGNGVDKTGIAASIYNSYDILSDDQDGIVQTTINGNQDSIKRLDKNVAEQIERINQLRQSLERQYAAADAALNQLNSQQTALTNILTALQNRKEN